MMSWATTRRWAFRAVFGLLLLAAVGGTWAAFNWTAIEVRYTAHRFATAELEEARRVQAERLVAKGEPGLAALTGFLDSDDPAIRTTAAGALTEAEFRAALAAAGLTDVEIRETHRVHDRRPRRSSARASRWSEIRLQPASEGVSSEHGEELVEHDPEPGEGDQGT